MATSATRRRDRAPPFVFFFYPFIVFFYRLRAEYENHQPKHLKKRSSLFFCLFRFVFPQKVSVRLHRSGLHGRRGKSNTFDYIQASPGPAPLPMVQYRYISIVALCTVCIDLYIGMYSSGGGFPALTGLPSPALTPSTGTVSAGGAVRVAAPSRVLAAAAIGPNRARGGTAPGNMGGRE